MSGRSATALLLLAVSVAAARPVATTSFNAGDEGPNPRSIVAAEAEGGVRMSVNLAGLGEGVHVHRARLRAVRDNVDDADGLLAAIRIFPGNRPAGKPLTPAPPWYDAFDTTEVVRRAVAGDGVLRLFVKSFPGWERNTTRLDVTYAATPARVPPPARDLAVLHRAG
ncbi:MAG: hypothetical protein ACYS5V_09755, partial [Planctomycetota bacterium]